MRPFTGPSYNPAMKATYEKLLAKQQKGKELSYEEQKQFDEINLIRLVNDPTPEEEQVRREAHQRERDRIVAEVKAVRRKLEQATKKRQKANAALSKEQQKYKAAAGEENKLKNMLKTLDRELAATHADIRQFEQNMDERDIMHERRRNELDQIERSSSIITPSHAAALRMENRKNKLEKSLKP